MSPTLHQTWMAAVLKIVALMLFLGVVVLAATEFQRQMFSRTSAAMETEFAVSGTLKESHLALADPATAVMYRFGGDEAAVGHVAAYDEAAARMTAALVTMKDVYGSHQDTTALPVTTVTAWETLDAGVDAAARRSPSQVRADAALMGAGQDPFSESAWAPYAELDLAIAKLSAHSLEDLHERNANAAAAQRIVVPVVVVTLLFGLFMMWRSARRLTHRVINPLLQLRHSALAIRDTNSASKIQLTGATVELEELANAMNETSGALRATHGALKTQAETDALTGLYNRAAFLALLEAQLAERAAGLVSVMFIDLDDFKVVNDSWGHAAGDDVLRIVAERLQGCLRSNDVLARLGGDEFGVVMRTPATGTIVAVAERIIRAMSQPATVQGRPTQLSCSVGIAVAPANAGAAAADGLVRNADFAMYMAKGKGKSRFEFFAPDMHTDMVATAGLKHDLAKALERGQLEVHYQPAVDLITQELSGYEALLRWHHPVHGLVPPMEFIPLAESTGDIVAIGEWVLDQACEFHTMLSAAYPRRPATWISVNVSPVQINTAFGDTVKAVLRRHLMPAEALILEITEDVAVTNTAEATAVLADLRRHGTRVALDDFGTGFSSLRYLHDLPVDVLKIDRSFISNPVPQTAALLEAITGMARSLGLSIVAEGVEFQADADRLLAFAPMVAQGFLFARPMPAKEAAAFGVVNLGQDSTSGADSSNSMPRVSGKSTYNGAVRVTGMLTTSAAAPNPPSESARTPNATRPQTAPIALDAVSQPAAVARSAVGKISADSAPSAGANAEPAVSPMR